jgi:hypothetical protein
MKNTLLTGPGIGSSAGAASIGFALVLLCLTGARMPGQQIKKKTELIFAKDRLAFEVAEAKSNSGQGNGTGINILRGISAAEGNPVPMPEDHSGDPDWDPNTDATVGLSLHAGMRCYARARDTATVLGTDGTRVLVEVSRPHYFYIGPRRGPALFPVAAAGTTTFQDLDDIPACLNKIRLWIDHDVFVALQGLPPAPSKASKKMKTKDDASDKEAVRRALDK